MSSCLKMITLMECIKQACWPDDGPLAILPGVDVSDEQKRMQANAAKDGGGDRPTCVAELPTLPPQVLDNLIRLMSIPGDLQQSVSVCFIFALYPFLFVCFF